MGGGNTSPNAIIFTMRRDEFAIKSNQLFEEVLNTIITKGVEYQSTEDVLSNFKDNSNDLGITKYQVWSVYFTKHVKSITSQIKKNPNNPSDTDSVEHIRSRIVDSVAYLLFLSALLDEQNSSN